MITTLAVGGYRSLRDLTVPLGRTTVVTGANGAGKSSLYRALRLLASAGWVVRDMRLVHEATGTPMTFDERRKQGWSTLKSAYKRAAR